MIKTLIIKIGIMCTSIVVVLFAIAIIDSTAFAAYSDPACEGQAAQSAYCQGKQVANNPITDTISKVSGFIAYISGFIAVVFVIIGGYKFVLSNGDAQKAASGRMTILYAVIGLVVIISARTIISLVLSRL